jgi:hypothetical protein
LDFFLLNEENVVELLFNGWSFIALAEIHLRAFFEIFDATYYK